MIEVGFVRRVAECDCGRVGEQIAVERVRQENVVCLFEDRFENVETKKRELALSLV